MISVLVVDDSKFMAKALGRLLSELGFNIVGVGYDGIEGVAQFESLRPEVTLLDVTMPNMDGVECLSRIREIDSDARVVMLSAIQDPATIEHCLKLGATSFLQKPIRKDDSADLNRLRETLENAAGAVRL
jgi:two-component system chemotaxis response regulator CheY